MSKNIAKCFFCYLMLFVLILYLVGLNGYQLNRFGMKTNGIIQEKLVSGHNQIRYKYFIEGIEYVGIGIPFQELSELEIGQTIEIVYSTREPSVSCICVPKAKWAMERQIIIFLPLGITLLLLILGKGKLNIKRK